MADLEFFWDPVCPWAWITSRWVTEVQQLRNYDVVWRFISLYKLNENNTAEWYTPDYRAGHLAGRYGHRVALSVLDAEGNDGVGRFYTALGTKIHLGRGRNDMLADPAEFCRDALANARLSLTHADVVLDDSRDSVFEDETALAQERTGKDVGTPILTFHPGASNEASFFGPVIAKAPRGDDALKLWDAIETIATTSGMAELKRSNRAKIDFT